MIDTHCHLTFPDFDGAHERILTEAAGVGVSGMITISTTTRDCLEALRIAETHDRVWCTAGVHPLYSDKGAHTWENLRLVASRPKCVAWGELGLDNHYPKPVQAVQRAVLDEQLAFIESCRRGGGGGGEVAIDKPIVLHCREAFADLIPVLRGTKLDPARFVFHCFTGGPEDMHQLLDFGAMVSFTGVVTYKNAQATQQAARMAPRERIMVETDAPFLPPEPVRTQRPCRPAMVRHTAEFLAVLRGEAFESFHEQLNMNARRFFGIDAY
ncbi:MAG: TatD family hydrolase [Phycisphaerales bacterium]